MVRIFYPLLFFVLLLTACGSEEEAGNPAENSDREVLLNIGVSLQSGEPGEYEGFAVEVPGEEIWQPDLEFTTDRAFSEFPVGQEERFYIYPEGPEGERYEVPFTMQPTMSSGMAHSKLHVEVYADSITVRGPAISDGRRLVQ